LAVEQAWRAVSGPGDWQWCSAAVARDIANAAANPAQAYADWQRQVQDALLRSSALLTMRLDDRPTPRRRGLPDTPEMNVT
jgi:hypothetical protein